MVNDVFSSTANKDCTIFDACVHMFHTLHEYRRLTSACRGVGKYQI